MIELSPPFRRATGADAHEMAELVDVSGDGLPVYLWGKLASAGQSGWAFGLHRAAKGLGGFAFENTVVRDDGGRVAACLIGYPLASSPMPKDEDLPELIPLLELQAMVSHTWYLNVIATYPRYRGKGYATALLELAELQARDAGLSTICLTTSDSNRSAHRLYERSGYEVLASRPMTKGDWNHDGENWLLFQKRW